MDREQLLPVGELELVERCDDLDAGVADQDVELPKASIALATPASTCGFVGDIHGDADGAAAAGSSSAAVASAPFWLRSAITTLAPSRGEDDGDLLADAAGGAGDDGDLVLQTHGSLRFEMSAIRFYAEIVVDDLAQAERQVGDDSEPPRRPRAPAARRPAQARADEVERGRAGPGAFQLDILEVVLAPARRCAACRRHAG